MVSTLISKQNPLIRLGNGKEQDECGEKCRSWMWPIAEDNDSSPFIYDEALATCGDTDTCPKIDTSPWKPEKAGMYSVPVDLTEKKDESLRKFCLCAKTEGIMYIPGSRTMAELNPAKWPKKLPCFKNHTCVVVGSGLHITA